MTSIWRTSGNIFVSILVVLSAFAGSVARAQTLDPMQVERFESDITVREDATMRVVETIYANFLTPRHGLLRTIPVTYDAGITRQSIGLSLVDVTAGGQPTPLSTSVSDGYLTMKVGDPDAYVEGPVVYQITYDVNRAFLYHDLTDELYWNVTGDQWELGIPETEVTIHVPGVEQQELDVSCYVGRAGSTDQTCRVATDDGVVRAFAEDFLTLSVSFPKDVIQEPGTWQTVLWWIQDNWAYTFLLVPVLVWIFMYRHWKEHGKDLPGRGADVVEYEPPKDMRPTEMGALTDTSVHDRDFAAGVVDLAVRGYVRIVEETGTLGFGKKYKLERLKPADAALKPFEKTILDVVFEKEESVLLTRGSASLVKARKEVEKLIYESMKADGYFVENPSSVRTRSVTSGVVVIFVTYFLGQMLTAWNHTLFSIPIAGVASGIIICIFGSLMPKRTEKGTEAFDKAKGFKLYLEKAEQYRLHWQEEENVFEKFLPYAMVFGVVDKWTKAVGPTLASSPAWFVGVQAFDATTFGGRLTSMISAVSTAAAPAKSGGSGGGGFSGGGFGGGGGGSW
jgi:uncharacterized membrane protein